ncbi:hypothetical protein [Halopiger xanaduensis]|uniref:Uncharacterized protein n=1 Tax=Halopiger xanaduensis (strain DSM 18323 / JCM 14033 / SH-6) TaxID=797210 RepID=F8DEN7_HALXS|nr:hypothetical protein [Halopiger xanaduensis]AEH39474.1 hypothetical protein Halxa_0234 [Halopiger xanaduensis SH-6]
MILATSDDYGYPHIDWLCKKCGEVYCYAGYPPETRCTNGHGHGWRPDPRQVNEYIDLLETLEPGDGIVISGDGPATLMGPIAEVGDGQLVTESIDSPSRTLRWERDDDAEGYDREPTLEWKKADDPDAFYDDVYHVETVDIRTESDAEVPA